MKPDSHAAVKAPYPVGTLAIPIAGGPFFTVPVGDVSFTASFGKGRTRTAFTYRDPSTVDANHALDIGLHSIKIAY